MQLNRLRWPHPREHWHWPYPAADRYCAGGWSAPCASRTHATEHRPRPSACMRTGDGRCWAPELRTNGASVAVGGPRPDAHVCGRQPPVAFFESHRTPVLRIPAPITQTSPPAAPGPGAAPAAGLRQPRGAPLSRIAPEIGVCAWRCGLFDNGVVRVLGALLVHCCFECRAKTARSHISARALC